MTKAYLIAIDVKRNDWARKKLLGIFSDVGATELPKDCHVILSLGSLRPGESSVYETRFIPRSNFDEFEKRLFDLGDLRYLSGDSTFGNVSQDSADEFRALMAESEAEKDVLGALPWIRSLIEDEMSRIRPAAMAVIESTPTYGVSIQLIQPGGDASQTTVPQTVRWACELAKVSCRGRMPDILEELYGAGVVPTRKELIGWFFGLEYDEARNAQPLGRAFMLGEIDTSDPKFKGDLHLSVVGAAVVPSKPPFGQFVSEIRNSAHAYFDPPVFERDRVLFSEELPGVRGTKTVPFTRKFGLRKLSRNLYIVKELSWPRYFLFHTREHR